MRGSCLQRYLRAALAFTLFGLLMAEPSTASVDRCKGFDVLVSKVAAIRQLQPVEGLRCRVVPEQEIRRNPYVVRAFAAAQRTVPKDEIIYKMLGFIPQSFPYWDCLTTLGPDVPDVLYDSSSRTILVRERSRTGKIALAQEIVRALLDQHFHTRAEESKSRDSTDSSMALFALLNGDAMNTAGMLESEEANDSFQEPLSEEVQQHPECTTPETLLFLAEFAQQFGVLYVHSFRENGGNAVLDEVFRHLPQSTKEILYRINSAKPESKPEATFTLSLPKVPAEFRREGFRLSHEDRLGEYVIRTLFRDYLGSAPAVNAARGWTEDRIALYRSVKGDDLLVWDTMWANAEEAKEFFQAFRLLLSIRYRIELARTLDRFVFRSSTDDRFEMSRDAERVSLSILRAHGSTE